MNKDGLLGFGGQIVHRDRSVCARPGGPVPNSMVLGLLRHELRVSGGDFVPPVSSFLASWNLRYNRAAGRTRR